MKALLILLAMSLTSCVAFKGFKQDALIEEVAEEVIEANTGLDVDLSPGSKE